MAPNNVMASRRNGNPLFIQIKKKIVAKMKIILKLIIYKKTSKSINIETKKEIIRHQNDAQTSLNLT